MAIRMAKQGAKISVVDLVMKTEDASETFGAFGAQVTVDEIKKAGGEATAIICDVSKSDSVKAAADQAREAFGTVTMLINNAGINVPGKVDELGEGAVEAIVKVNLVAHFHTIREFLPDMKKNNKGHIVTISSVAGVISVPN